MVKKEESVEMDIKPKEKKVQQKPQFKPQTKPQNVLEPGMRHLVRIANTDLSGEKQLIIGLQKIKGVNFMFANALCSALNLDPTTKVGRLTEKEETELNRLISDPVSGGIPYWLFNRRKDPESGKDSHLIGADVKFTMENDIKIMKKLKTYKGIRHAHGLPVRGQRTKANFRRNKKKMMKKRK